MRDGDPSTQTEIAISSLLSSGLEELEIGTTPAQIAQLTRLVVLLSQWAPRINLTGHRDPVSMATRLVLDAAALSSVLPELMDAQSLADLGSGAGFPGLPLAILHPHLAVRLVEARRKRSHFQRAARRDLGLENVSSILGRSDRVDTISADIVIAQAMTQPGRALELMLPWALRHGILALPASEAADAPAPPPGIGPLAERSYPVPGAGIRRKLWIARRISI